MGLNGRQGGVVGGNLLAIVAALAVLASPFALVAHKMDKAKGIYKSQTDCAAMAKGATRDSCLMAVEQDASKMLGGFLNPMEAREICMDVTAGGSRDECLVDLSISAFAAGFKTPEIAKSMCQEIADPWRRGQCEGMFSGAGQNR